MKRVAAAAALVMLAVSPASGAPLARSVPAVVHQDDLNDQKNSVDQNISDLQETLAGTSKQLTAAYTQYAKTQAQLSAAQAAWRTAHAVEQKAKQKNADLATRLAAAELAQANAQQELAKGQAAIKLTQQRTGQFAAQVYRNNGVSPQLDLLLGSSGPDDFANKSAMVDYVLQYQNGSMRALEQQKASNITIQDRLTSVQQQVSLLKKQAAAAYQEAKAASAQAAVEAGKVKAALTAQAKVVASIKARKGEEDAKMASLKAEQQRLTNMLRERAARKRAAEGQGQVGPTGGILNNPVPGTPVTSGFGWRYHPIYHTMRLHEGMDFGAACGTPVYAAADGDVISAGVAGGYGNRIMIDHGLFNGNDLVTTYNHLSRFVTTGGHVNRGQLVAYSGTTGSSTGCHLHFEVRLNGTAVNPAPYL